MIEWNTGLNPGAFLFRIDLKNVVQVLGKVDHDGDIAALPGKACAATASQDRCAVFACQSNRLDDIFDRLRDHDANRHLAVVGAIRGIESAAPVVKADLTADYTAQVGGESVGAVTREFPVRRNAVPGIELDGLCHYLTS
jgi:hypothetical protein